MPRAKGCFHLRVTTITLRGEGTCNGLPRTHSLAVGPPKAGAPPRKAGIVP